MLQRIRHAVGRAIWWFLVPLHEERQRALARRDWLREANRYGGVDHAPSWLQERVERTKPIHGPLIMETLDRAVRQAVLRKPLARVLGERRQRVERASSLLARGCSGAEIHATLVGDGASDAEASAIMRDLAIAGYRRR